MKYGFDKPYFPIQKVDNPEIDVDVKTSRSFGKDVAQKLYENIVAHAFNAGIRYANKVIKQVLTDEIFNRHFASEYIEFNDQGIYRLCENVSFIPFLNKNEDYLICDYSEVLYSVKRLKDKVEVWHVAKVDVNRYFYRTFEEKKYPRRSVPKHLFKNDYVPKDLIIEKNVNVWGHNVGEVRVHKWPSMDSEIPKQTKPRKGQIVTLKKSGISEFFKPGDIVRYTGETEVRNGKDVYYFENLSDPKKRIGFPEEKLLECIDFGPSFVEAYGDVIKNEPLKYDPYYTAKPGDFVRFAPLNFFWDDIEKYDVGKNDEFEVIEITDYHHKLKRLSDGKIIYVDEVYRGIMFTKVNKPSVKDSKKSDFNAGDYVMVSPVWTDQELIKAGLKRDKVYFIQQLNDEHIIIKKDGVGGYYTFFTEVKEEINKRWIKVTDFVGNKDLNKCAPDHECAHPDAADNSKKDVDIKTGCNVILGTSGQKEKSKEVKEIFVNNDVDAKVGHRVDFGTDVMSKKFYEESEKIRYPKEPVSSFAKVFVIRKYWLTDFYCGLHKNTILELMGNELSTMTDKSPFKVLQTEDIANIGRELRVPNKMVKEYVEKDFV